MRLRITLLMLLSLLLTGVAVAAAQVVVEDWSSHPVGARGIPQGWKGQNWGSPSYDMTIVEDGGKRVLHLKSRSRLNNTTYSVLKHRHYTIYTKKSVKNKEYYGKNNHNL